MSDQWKDYLCSYPFGRNGAQWSLTIRARSEAEALERLKAIGGWGTVDGQLMATIPAYPGAGLFVRAFVWLRNLFRRPSPQPNP